MSTQIADDELVKIGAGLSLSQTMNARIIVEKKTPGSEEWTSAATGKIHIDGRLLLQNSVYCGWR
ncbi:MAG: hypothetical protein ACTMH5_04655 [Brachybacterium sp.]|uniref:hypothetical protein n=1 Tax=Brachybacterium sp. TaxID=1891286 RepID=UPI003F92CE05